MTNRTLAWLALPLALCCANCAPKPIRIAAPPAERLRPVAEPAVPAGNSDAEVASYLIDLTDALRQANGRLSWLSDWYQGTGAVER